MVVNGQLRLIAGALLACCASAQLISLGTPLPRTSKLPVVFINGFQNICSNSSFSSTFGSADQVLQANGEASVFFDICSVSGSPTIEDLGAALGSFLANLRYVDGQPVDRVDVVAHSMGGLVLRSYLSGKQNAAGTFQPPAVTHVRKVVFLATPHFGSGIALTFGLTPQLRELASGSRFLFDLGTWNQGTDDLRGVDAIAAIGNGGTGRAVMAGFDDGVVALTAASLRFYQTGRTRVLPYCHVNGGGLVSFAGLCTSDARGIANIPSSSHDSARLIVSFFNGADDWKSIGVAAENDPFLSIDGGLIVTARTSDDLPLALSSVRATSSTGQSKQLNLPSNDVAYTDLFPAGPVTLAASSSSANVNSSVTLPAGGVEPYTVKSGTQIARVLPAAANVFPLSLAPGMFVSIYGAALAAQTMQASGLPYPLQLADAQVMFNNTPLSLSYVSAAQINAVIPDSANGLAMLMVRSGAGNRTVNVFVEAAMPAIFTLDGSGTGSAAAINATNHRVAGSGNPLHAGDYVELYATGLGVTTNRNGLDYANQQPTVTVGGKDCPVTYAGRAPGYIGLDQINCIIPAGLGVNAAAPVVITSGIRSSNVATLAVQ